MIFNNFEYEFIKIFKKTSLYSLNKFKIRIINLKSKDKSFKEIILETINCSSILSFIYFIFFLFKNFEFKNRNKIDKKYKQIFFNYFTQYDEKKFEKKIFKPNQWPKFFAKNKNIYWFNIFLPNKNFKSIQSVNEYVNTNKIKNINFINNHFDYPSLFRIIKIFFYFNFKYFKYVKFHQLSKNRRDYYLFFEKEIKRSLCCFQLLLNLSYHFLLKNIFEKNSFIKDKFFYLFENQPWERSLNFLLRKKNIYEVYGYSHTTINYWHLNYFNSHSENKNFRKNHLPEKILCHSQNCRDHLLNQGISKKQILNVSAERFKWSKEIKKKKISKKNNILIIGDYEKDISKNLVKIINNLYENFYIKNKYLLDYKPHPSTNFNKIKLNKKINIIEKNLKKIIHKYDIIISTNSTAASAELSTTNKKILIFLDTSNLDLSPFKVRNKYKNNFNFINEHDLLQKIKGITNIKKLNYNFYFEKKYFFTWKKLIK